LKFRRASSLDVLTTGDLLHLFGNLFVIEYGNIKENFCTTFLDQILLAAMVNPDDSQCHSPGANLAGKMTLVELARNSMAEKGHLTSPPPAPAFHMSVSDLFRMQWMKTIPITTHWPLFASDLRKAEYLKMGCKLRLPMRPYMRPPEAVHTS
jgi:hypothetical protein